MRIIILFDLPTTTLNDKKEYQRFRKFLVNEGFLMMQYSIYSKIALNNTNLINIKTRIEKNKTQNGLIQMLVITEKQYAGIEYISGENKTNIINNIDRMVVL